MVFFLFASTIRQHPIQKARKEVWAPPHSAGEGSSVQEQGCSQPHGDYSPSQEYCGTSQLPHSRPYCHSRETKALQSQCQLTCSYFLECHGPVPFCPQVQNLRTPPLLTSNSYLETSERLYSWRTHPWLSFTTFAHG